MPCLLDDRVKIGRSSLDVDACEIKAPPFLFQDSKSNLGPLHPRGHSQTTLTSKAKGVRKQMSTFHKSLCRTREEGAKILKSCELI